MPVSDIDPRLQDKGATSHARHVARVKKWLEALRNLEIFVVLILFLLAGCLTIREADGLADRPLISALAEAALFPPHKHGLTPDPQEHEVRAHFIRELGIAILVAAILGLTFEFFMRRREEKAHIKHLTDIERAGLSSLLGQFIPPAIVKQIKSVFGEKIMRSNLEVSYRFENLLPEVRTAAAEVGLDDRDLLLATVTLKYDLVNLSSSTVDHIIHHGFDAILPFGDYSTDNYNKFLSLEITNGGKPWLSWHRGQTCKGIDFSRGPAEFVQVLRLKHPVPIEPGEETSGWPIPTKVVRVVVRHQLVRRCRDLDNWTSWLPANGLRVKAESVGENPPDLRFRLARVHPEDFEPADTATERQWILPSHPTQRNGQRVNETAAVLPFQGFTLFWYPSANTSASLRSG